MQEMLTAITRAVSPEINNCELGYLPRQEIDVAKAVEQHRQYETCLKDLGAEIISLPAEPGLPDCMFVEDPAVVVDQIAVMARMGAESRRREAESLAPVLARFRPLEWLRAPATLELARVFRRAGHRVVMAESLPWHLSRPSRAVALLTSWALWSHWSLCEQSGRGPSRAGARTCSR